MRRTNSSPSVSLFPFLAVLVCAMGALILLLLVTTRKMRQVAVARAMAEEQAARESTQIATPPSPRPVPVQPVTVPETSETAGPSFTATGPTPEELAAQEAAKAAERRAVRVAREARQRINDEARARQVKREREWQRMLVELEAKRDSTKERLRESRTLVLDLKNQLQRTEANLALLRDRKAQLGSKLVQDETQRAQIELQHQQLTDEIAKTQQEFTELRKAHADASSKYAFIPYDGASGTTRRPIYLECTAAGVRFQPEGILLDENDLKGFTESENPLLFATQAVAEYWRANPTREDDPRHPRRPYVLLIVRPSGTVTYYVARKMLTQIGDDFGYELIEDDFPLQVPPSEGKTKVIIEQAIAEALRHRGESLAEGGRVGAARLGQVVMGRSEEAIEFGTLNAQKVAAIAAKESPFRRHSTRGGKNFSITRSPVGSDEVLPESFRTEIERHANETNRLAANQGRPGTGGGASELPGRTGTTAGVGNGPDMTQFNRGGNGNGQPTGPGVVEIQRGRGRRNQFGGSTGTGTGTGQPGSPAGRIPQLPKLSDPFSRDALADGGPSFQAEEDVDAALGFSPGNDSQSSTGTQSGTGSESGNRGLEDLSPGTIPGTRSARVMQVDPAVAPNLSQFKAPPAFKSQSQFNGTDLESGPTDPELDPRVKRPGQVPGVRMANGARSTGDSGTGAGNVNNPFDRTAGAVVTDKFTAEAERQINGASRNGAINAGSVPTRKSFGNNPQENVKRQAKSMTPQQKQDLGRQRWGGSNLGQIGFERKVKVQVLSDRMIIGKNEVEIPLEHGATREELVDAVLNGLDENSRSWDTPPKKFYWIPYLQFEVYQGGIVPYEQVHGPLKEWGLYSDVKFKEGIPAEPGLIRPASTEGLKREGLKQEGFDESPKSKGIEQQRTGKPGSTRLFP